MTATTAMNFGGLPPRLLLLMPAIVLAAMAPPVLWAANLLNFVMCGWKSVRERFPAREHQKAGDTYKGQCGFIRPPRGYILRGLTVGVVLSGVYLYPRFARRSPCFIPWSSIRRAVVRGRSIVVSVEYERGFDFTLPYPALSVLEVHLEPGKVQRLPPVSAVLVGFARSYWAITLGVFGTMCFAVLETVSSLSVWKELLISAVAGALGVVGMYLVLPSPQGKRPKRWISGEAQTLKAQTDLERPV